MGDHDFTRTSIVPSSLIYQSPLSPFGTRGKFWSGLKDATFEPSSSPRHIAELHQIVAWKGLERKPILFLYTNGGPDHRLSVQLTDFIVSKA